MNGDKPTQNTNEYENKSRQNAQNFQQKPPTDNSTAKSKLPFFKQHKLSLAILGIASVATTAIVVFTILQLNHLPQPEPPQPPKVAKKPDPVWYSPLSHQKLDKPELAKSPVTAIMVENSPNARPQSGLKDAEIVFEAIAEGGITRFLVLYQINKPSIVGPVRSVRKYYLDWVTPFQASIAHVGGSDEALRIVRNGSYRDIDQFFNGSFYWRSTDRYAPHNVYTNFEKLDALNKQKKYFTSEPKTFARTITKLDKNNLVTVKNINLTISSPLYNVNYEYNPQTNSYNRFVGGKQHLDREKGQISPKAVVAIMTDMRKSPTDGYHEQITTTGKDKAYIFQNGKLVEGFWEKPKIEEQITFYDSNNNVLPIESGQVWITAIPKSSGGVSWQ